jgi:CobQ-like glutamine amidotransferase family enzyme
VPSGSLDPYREDEVRIVLNLVHLYPGLLNLYGDRGNIITLRQRCRWRDIELRVYEVGLNEALPDVPIDLLFMGGDQDREQGVVVEDLRGRHAGELRNAVDDGVPFLAVCGSFQLLQRYYHPAVGPDMEGIGIFDAYTVHPGPDVPRCVGNIVVDWQGHTVVGFENHGGRTYLEGATQPLGTVLSGHGNNGADKTEGARIANTFGTYIHGSLLPKNPVLADTLLRLALERRYPAESLAPLDDSLESAAHAAAVTRATSRHRALFS